MKRLVAMSAAAAGMALATAAMTTGIDVAEGDNAIPCPAKAVAAMAVTTNTAGTASVKMSKVTPLYVGGRLVKAWTNTVWEASLDGGISTNSLTECRFLPGDFLLCETTNAAPWRATVVLEN